MKPQHINLEYCCPEEYEEQLATSLQKFEDLVKQGYPYVRVVDSTHTYTEGLWIEATTDKFTDLDRRHDTVIKSHFPQQNNQP